MRIRYIYKTYRESFSATAFSAFGSTSIILGLVFFVLFFIPQISENLISSATIFLAVVILIFIVGGICSMMYAPRHAEKAMRKRISADFEYGRYIAEEYPQYISLVKELQPRYNENDKEPIIDYYKKAQDIPLWRRILGIAMFAIAGYIVYKTNN